MEFSEGSENSSVACKCGTTYQPAIVTLKKEHYRFTDTLVTSEDSVFIVSILVYNMNPILIFYLVLTFLFLVNLYIGHCLN